MKTDPVSARRIAVATDDTRFELFRGRLYPMILIGTLRLEATLTAGRCPAASAVASSTKKSSVYRAGALPACGGQELLLGKSHTRDGRCNPAQDAERREVYRP